MLRPQSTYAIAVCLLPLIGMSCVQSPAVGQPGAGEVRADTGGGALSLKERAARYSRPYGDGAPWNRRVNGLRQHPESAKYSDLLWHKAAMRPGNFNIGTYDYTYAVYSVTEAVGMYKVSTEWESNLDGKLMPWNPAWRPAPGTDAQIIVIDEANGREWNLWKVKFPFNGVIRAKHANIVPGDYRRRVEGFVPSRGSGISYLAMLVRPEEIARGKIEHALSMPIRNPSGQYFVPPATKLERSSGRPGIPEGMRFALRVSDQEIEDWIAGLRVPAETQRAARIIAVALRDYGWFVTDTSGSAGFQFESSVSAPGEWEQVGLGPIIQDAAEYPRDLLDGLLTRDRIYAIVDSDRY